jgi:hypothetical protein
VLNTYSGAMTQVTVTVDDTHLRSIGTVARSLERTGMRVDKVMAAVGVITGSVDSGTESTLTRVPGVASVDRDNSYQLPSPGAEVQ